jgi:hypothetical protein
MPIIDTATDLLTLAAALVLDASAVARRTARAVMVRWLRATAPRRCPTCGHPESVHDEGDRRACAEERDAVWSVEETPHGEAMGDDEVDPIEFTEVETMLATIECARADAAWCRDARPVDLAGAARAEAVVAWAEGRLREIRGEEPAAAADPPHPLSALEMDADESYAEHERRAGRRPMAVMNESGGGQ